MATVDVVIATFNRPARLARTLAALEGQTRRDFGVIVIDDASTPPVESTLDPRFFASLRLRVLRLDDNHGPGRARNLGIAASEADLIAFVDDDVDPVPGWLATHVAVADPQTVSIGPLLAPPGWRPTPWNWWEAATLAREYRRMEEGLYAPTFRQFFTGNALVHRADLIAAGLFVLLRENRLEWPVMFY